jgi:hypothetical protein
MLRSYEQLVAGVCRVSKIMRAELFLFAKETGQSSI